MSSDLCCRARKRPALDMVEYLPRTSSRGLLRGICPTCERLMYCAASLASIEQMRSGLDITFPKAKQRLDDSPEPFPSVVFTQVQKT